MRIPLTSKIDVAPKPGLERGISRNHLIGLSINATIGAGILGLPSKVFALVGSYSLLTWLICAFPVLSIALCLAEVSTRFRDSGGPYLYARVVFGPTTAFITGWLRLLTTTLAYATVCDMLIDYLAELLPSAVHGMGRVGTATVVTGALAFLLVRGLRGTVWLSTALSVGKVLLFVLFILVGAFAFDSSRIHWTPTPQFHDIGAAILLSIFAFFGFEAGSIVGGELSDPARDMPVAIGVSVGVTTSLYVLIQLICIGSLGSLATSSRPVADAATAMLGRMGGVAVTIGAVPLLLGVLLAILIASSRNLFAMGEQAQMPAAVAFVHPHRRTPVVAIVVMAAAAWGATIASSFTSAITIAVGTRVLTYLVICASLPILRRRVDVAAAHFRLPAGDFIAAFAILSSITLLAATQLRESVEIVALVVVGLAFQKLLRRDV